MPSKLFQKLGRVRRPVKADLKRAALKPPRREIARYIQRIESFWMQWRGAVRGELGVRLDSWREDAKILEATYAQLLENSHLGAFLEDLAGDVDERIARYMTRVVRVSSSVPGREIELANFRRRNIELIKGLGQDQIAKMQELLANAAQFGVRAESLAPEIQKVLDVGESRARLIARDQTLKINSQFQQLHQRSAGATEYIWSTSRDEKVRDGSKGPQDHASLDGTKHSWDDPPDTGTGPAHPGEDPQCRCAAIPVFPLFDDES